MNSLQKITHNSKRYLQNRSPTILTCISVFGVVVTTALAVKATPKALKALETAENEKGKKLTKFEAMNVAYPPFIPTVIVGVSTIACIFGANMLNKRQQASLASAYALLEETFKEYRKSANKVFGEDADSKIIAEIANDKHISCDGWHIYNPDHDEDSEKLLFYDFYSQRYFNATYGQVVNAQYHINRNLQLRSYASVNEFYDFLGIDGIQGGDDVGWDMNDLIEDGYGWLDFDNRFTKMDDGMECYIITSDPEPIYRLN